ncbi:MAG: hypothetical protein NC548_52205 [Lachnospiraceae bacterium]|nr:hypothetical protein [Lachnospiraceae bacterium]
MPRTNFSNEDKKIFNLTRDLVNGDFSSHIDKDKVTKADLENYLKDKINNDILKGRTLYQAFRSNNILMFEIIEEIVNTTIEENVFDSPFVDSFVEIKNRRLGDTTAFYSEGGLLSVASFAGNHWDTNRQFIDVGNEITLPKEWIYIHIYEDLERFLLNISTPEKLTDKIYKSVNKYIQDRIHMEFQNLANALPVEFTQTGNSEEAIGKLCDTVQAAGAYSSLIIAGTRGALRKLANTVPDKMFADTQKEAKTMTGAIGYWEGCKLMPIPQTLKSGTFELALDDTKLFIIGGDTKPIKLEFFGDSRTDYGTDGKKNNDQSVDLQVQTKLGIGLVVPPACGVFTFGT